MTLFKILVYSFWILFIVFYIWIIYSIWKGSKK